MVPPTIMYVDIGTIYRLATTTTVVSAAGVTPSEYTLETRRTDIFDEPVLIPSKRTLYPCCPLASINFDVAA